MLGSLREQVREVISTLAAPSVREDLLEVLGRPGYALHPDGLCRAGVLALEVHEAVVPDPHRGLLAAAAVELQMEAAYLFDEVADTTTHGRRSEDLALAIALLTTGGAAAAEAAATSPDPVATLHHFCAAYGEAAAGQFLDAMLQRRGNASLEEALEATCLKSGGLGKLAAGFGARVAGADGHGAELFERFGSHIFTFAQLIDDLRDACAPGPDSDLSQGKATLAVVFYRRGIDSVGSADGMLSCDIRGTYESSGAPLYVGILAQTCMDRSEEDLSSLARHGYAVGGLISFLRRLELGAGEALSAARGSLVG